MRSATTILLLLLFTAQTELGQIFRIPFAVQHYLHHRQAAGRLPLVHFLKDHYNPQHQDADEATDQQLPFNHYNIQTLTLMFLPPALQELETQPQKMFQNPFTLITQSPLSQRAFSIFHPPQAV